MIDGIHGCFGVLAILFTLMNIIILAHDKEVKGVCMSFMIFLCIFTGWNIFYLTSLGQDVAVAGAVCLFIANVIWCGQMIYYLILESRN